MDFRAMGRASHKGHLYLPQFPINPSDEYQFPNTLSISRNYGKFARILEFNTEHGNSGHLHISRANITPHQNQ